MAQEALVDNQGHLKLVVKMGPNAQPGHKIKATKTLTPAEQEERLVVLREALKLLGKDSGPYREKIEERQRRRLAMAAGHD